MRGLLHCLCHVSSPFSLGRFCYWREQPPESGNEWQGFKGREGEKEEEDNAAIQVKEF